VAAHASLRQFKAAICPSAREPALGQSLQARSIRQASRSARAACKAEAVQGRAATGFEVGLIPHALTILRARRIGKRGNWVKEAGRSFLKKDRRRFCIR